MRFKPISFFFLLHSFFIFSYESSPDRYNNSYNTPHVEMQVNNYNAQQANNWHVSGRVITMPDYADNCSADYSVIAQQASPELKNYFAAIVAPLMHDATIKNHCVAIPGYVCPDGLRYCIQQLSQFSGSDAALIAPLAKRLESYCTFTERILFNGDNHSFCDTISHKDQVTLVKLYANFLKEFYAGAAPYIFYQQSQESSLMQQVMPSIHWGSYDGSNSQSSQKKREQYYAASVNGKLGELYKALHDGYSEKAYNIGHEHVQTVMPGKIYGKTENVTSVFEQYPALHQRVEQERIARQNIARQGAGTVKIQSAQGIAVKALIPGPDILQDRNSAATVQVNDPRFFEKFHAILAEQAACIKVHHLTPDQAGILLEGGHLQHHIVDETITVVDVAISNDLAENLHNAVVDLANTTLTLNKDGDVVTATRALDACWALLDYAHDAARYTYSIAATHLPFVAKGACDGACESLHGAVHMVCHPVEAVQDAAQSLAVAGYYLGKVAYAGCVYEAACDALEAEPKRYEQIMAQYAIDPDALLAVYEHTKNNISAEDVARIGTKTALDMMLLHSATKAVSAIVKECWAELISCMRKGEQSSEVALTAENISVQCGQEIASVAESMQKSGVGAEVKRYGKQGSPYQKISKSTQHARPLNSLEGKELLGIENISTSGYGPLSKRIYLNKYKHYLQPELRATARGKIKPSGWHHDPGRRIESIKRVNGYKIEIINQEKHASGIYRFDWGVEGMRKKRSTFFPHTWSRETVQQKIVEAYKYVRKYKKTPVLQKDTNNFLLSGFTKDGIEIAMIIDQQGIMISAYPKW